MSDVVKLKDLKQTKERQLPENFEEMSLEELKTAYKKLLKDFNFRNGEVERQEDENKFLMAAIENLPNAIVIKDLDGCVVQASASYGEIFGEDINMLPGRNSLEFDFLDRDECIRLREEDEKLLEEGGIIHYEEKYTFADGQTHPCFYWSKGFKVPDAKWQIQGIVSEVVDVSKEKKLEEELSDSLNALKKAKDEIEYASKIDPGTGLYNRYVFDDQTKDIISDARENGTPVSIMLCDLDHFKRVNDTFGHLEGDRVLRNFADILKSQIRSEDVAIRYGGEEFLVFLPGTTLPQAKMAAERIRETTQSHMTLPDSSNITVSIGLVRFNPEETRTQCIARADEALYTAKETGRNKVIVFGDDSEQVLG